MHHLDYLVLSTDSGRRAVVAADFYLVHTCMIYFSVVKNAVTQPLFLLLTLNPVYTRAKTRIKTPVNQLVCLYLIEPVVIDDMWIWTVILALLSVSGDALRLRTSCMQGCRCSAVCLLSYIQVTVRPTNRRTSTPTHGTHWA
jgi:hypothetical protein